MKHIVMPIDSRLPRSRIKRFINRVGCIMHGHYPRREHIDRLQSYGIRLPERIVNCIHCGARISIDKET